MIKNKNYIVGLLLLLPTVAFAAPINIDQMLSNIQEQVPYLTKFITGFAYLSGIFFMFNAMYKLKEYGEARTMTSSHTDLRGPMVSFIAGACLLFTPSFMTAIFVTVFGDNSIMQYSDGDTGWDQMANTIVSIVYLVGGIAVIRGLFYLHKAGLPQSQQGNLAKGSYHLIGGVLAMNIVGFTHILATTLGIE